MNAHELIVRRIRERGPITVADFMSIALYHPDAGDHARDTRRTGRTGDFFTSVDVGPLFGALLCRQFGEMWRLLCARASGPRTPFDIVEAGASNGQLARDVLDAAHATDPDFYDVIRLHLVEASPAARAAQRVLLAGHTEKLAASTATLPETVHGVIYANELLDALPVHRVVMTAAGLRECYVDLDGDTLVERPGPLSSEVIARHLQSLGAVLEPGWQAEVNLAAIAWTARASRALRQGFLLLVDYGHEANELYSVSHATGTLTTFTKHTSGVERTAAPVPWLARVGEQDITSHVDLTSVCRTAENAGCQTLGLLDQTYFLLPLWTDNANPDAPAGTAPSVADTRRRLAFRSLVMPGGLGSTHKVMVFGKDVGRPTLLGLSGPSRLT